MDKVIEFLRQHQDEHLEWARELCRIPSITTQEEHKADVRSAVEWTRSLCEKIGLKAEIHETGGHPLVVAEWTGAPGAPTYMAYGHVDVQPTGDLSLWDADPFEPVVDGDWLVCRGSADDKGQVLIYIRAAQAWLETHGKLPINLKLLIEGEEEVGSPNLAPFVDKHRDLLGCEGVMISDTGLFADGVPTITYGTRGLCYKEVRLFGPKFDLHSGSHGGPVTNPANALAKLIASLHDEKGRVTIPGFYDNVVEVTDAERELTAKFPLDEKQYAADLGVSGFTGEDGYTVEERRSARPTLDVNGIYGGYMKEGANTIIPSMAGAKISMRLVPDQVGKDIAEKFEKTIRQRCPDTLRCEILDHAYASAYMAPLDSKMNEAAARALQKAFDGDVAFVREGGSLPILPMFRELLGADCLLMGFASPNCNAHGPNEKVSIGDLNRGAEAAARLFAELGPQR